jgi:hypothetical protein
MVEGDVGMSSVPSTDFCQALILQKHPTEVGTLNACHPAEILL